MHTRILLIIALVGGSRLAMGADAPDLPVPLPQAHAHNDYLHARPLRDALDHGFCGVEADVFLVGELLLVAHERSALKPERTLQALYLDPLRARVKKHRGSVYPNGPPLTLLIDLKSPGESTYRKLAGVLADYADILSVVVDGKPTPGPVSVVISGNRPWRVVEAESRRFVGVDGRLSDLDSTRPAHLMPWISDNWSLHFRWRGVGPIGADEGKKLRELVARAHAAGRRVRFWATPDKPAVWAELLAAGVDLINADDLAGLQAFLLDRRTANDK